MTRLLRADSRGSILISSLWIVGILALLAVGIGFRAVLELRLNERSMDRLRATYFARAGVFKAQDLLLRDKPAPYDNLYTCGVTFAEGENPERVFGGETNKLDGGSFSIYYDTKGGGKQYGLMDEERRININVAGNKPADVAEFKRMMKSLSSNLTDETVNAILDWQDEDSDPLPGDAEDPYYMNLEHPYHCKNWKFIAPEELLLVKGITPQIFDEIKDSITVWGSGKINVNTAPEKVLNAVFNDDGHYNDLISKIRSFQRGPDLTEGTADDGHFVNIPEDMSQALDLSLPESVRIATLSGFLTTTSTAFRIVSHGTAGNVTRTVTYVVERDRNTATGPLPCRYYHEV